jgi:hypothetical protein
MISRFDAVHNYNDEAVIHSIAESAFKYPQLAGDPDLLADVAFAFDFVQSRTPFKSA